MAAALPGRKLIVWVLIACAVAGGAALLWKVTPLAQLVKPELIARRLETLESFRWTPIIFLGAYVVGGLVMFPVMALGAASAIVFPPLEAVAVSFTGNMLSAALLYGIGARLLGDRFRKRFGPTIEKVDEALNDRGIVTIATLRMVPLAPFTLVNLAAGSVRVRFRDYMLGTALGLAPGATVICLFGRQVRAFWREPSLSAMLWIAAVGVAWIATSLVLQRWVARRNRGANRA